MTEQHITEKQAKRKILMHDIIELIIGVILLWICYGCIQTHPAERISFFSGYKVIYQQTEIFIQNILGNNGDLLKQKYSLESYYQVLITLAEEKPCINPQLLVDIETTYKSLQEEPKNTLEHTLSYYIQKQYEFDAELRKECDAFADESNTTANEPSASGV